MDRIELRIANGGGGVRLDVAGGGGNIPLNSERVHEVYIDREPYEGEYTVTPSLDAQILDTQGKAMRDDVTVAPIPNNYGRIAWNGTTLIVY